MNRRTWIDRDIALVRELYPHVHTAKIASQLGSTTEQIYSLVGRLGLRKTAEYLASPDACRLRRRDDGGVHVGARTCFKKGHVPANKGLRRPGWGPGRMKETQFRKGQIPASKREIGELRINSDGYIDMKIGEGKGALAWRALHTMLWEDAHGPVPPGFALVFKDRDKLNVDLTNLELVSRADLCRRNSIHNLPPALKRTINQLGALKRRIRREEQDRGLAQSPLRYTRRPARQRAADGH